MAYTLINKTTNEATIVMDKLKLSSILGVHRHTITNRFKKSLYFETELYHVYKPKYYFPHVRGGNRDSMSVKIAKKNGEYTEE